MGDLYLVYPYNMVIFHSKLFVYQRINPKQWAQNLWPIPIVPMLDEFKIAITKDQPTWILGTALVSTKCASSKYPLVN